MFNRAVNAFRKRINKKSKSNLSSDDESTSSVVSTTSSIRNDRRRRRRGEGTLCNPLFCLIKSIYRVITLSPYTHNLISNI